MKKNETFKAQDRVDHAVYGTGTIIDANERHTTIRFDGAGTKKFVTEKVRLVRSNTPAPDKPPRRSKKKAARAD